MDESLRIGLENEWQRLRCAQEEFCLRYHERVYYHDALKTAQIIPGVQGYNLDEKLLLTDQLV